MRKYHAEASATPNVTDIRAQKKKYTGFAVRDAKPKHSFKQEVLGRTNSPTFPIGHTSLV
jgi:hypothetical protein